MAVNTTKWMTQHINYHGANTFDVNDTLTIPDFASLKNTALIIIIVRRWGYVASVVLTKLDIASEVTGSIILNNTSGGVSGNRTKLNVATNGVITVAETTNPVGIDVVVFE